MKKFVKVLLVVFMILSIMTFSNVEAYDVSIGARVMINNDDGINIVEVGNNLKLSLTYVEISESDIKTVEWTSSNPAIATVDQNGNVKGIKEGKVKITVTAREKSDCDDLKPGESCIQVMPEEYKDEYDIEVVKADDLVTIGEKISIKSPENKNTIKIDESLKLSIDFIEMSEEKVYWESSNSQIATIDSNGNVKGKSVGKTIIKAYTADKKYTDEFTLYVKDNEPVSTIGEKIVIKVENDVASVFVGKSIKLSVDFIELSETSIDWEVDDENIASIDSNGNLTGINGGIVTIKAYTKDRKFKDEIWLLVIDKNEEPTIGLDMVIEAENNKNIINVGEILKLNIESASEIKWESSDNSIATVNSIGEVIGKNNGIVTIRAITKDGIYAEYNLEVKSVEDNKGDEKKNNYLLVIITIVILMVVIGVMTLKNKDRILEKLNKKNN